MAGGMQTSQVTDSPCMPEVVCYCVFMAEDGQTSRDLVLVAQIFILLIKSAAVVISCRQQQQV